MHKYAVGDKVRVRLPLIGTKSGYISLITQTYMSYLGPMDQYTVVFDDKSPTQVFFASDLIPIKITWKCTCGAEKTGQPGHSYFCDSMKNIGDY